MSKSLCSTVAILLGQRVVHVDLTCGGRLICTALCCLRVVLRAMVMGLALPAAEVEPRVWLQ